ncbi:MAG TPA: hypothetical protein VG603_15080, partial [Chitinophagales bacterium]|nr:hypothetical protein [Chitinophagales bacterium]
SLNSTMTKVSPLLPVPGYGIHLERFPTVYVDKDSRFVAKTDLNFDSLTAVKKVEDYKAYVGTCLDTTKWVWLEQQGDDSTTVFFKELKEWQAVSDTFTLSLAVTNVAHKVYSINMYIKRNDK